MASIHEAAESLLKVNAISKATMREFDKTCLTPIPLTGEQIRALRQRERASQTVFAGASVSEFVVSTAEEAAKRTIEEEAVFRVSIEDQGRLVPAQSKPARPTAGCARPSS